MTAWCEPAKLARMCRWCDTDPDLSQMPPPARAVQQRIEMLLPLIETPEALPAPDALRISQTILSLLDDLDRLLGDDRPCQARFGLPRSQPGDRPAFQDFH